jgi:tyrosinase
VTSPGLHTVETFGSTDVVTSLFGPNNSTNLIAEDDDSGEGRNSKVVASLATGSYSVMVRHYDRASTGEYRIRVRRG